MNSNQFVNKDPRIDALVEKLRNRLNNFTVMDRQGELMGQVKDLILDANRQLNLVVSHWNINQSSRLYLLISKLIQKIDPPNKSVMVDIYQSQIEQLPEYVNKEITGGESSKTSISSTKNVNVIDADIVTNNDRYTKASHDDMVPTSVPSASSDLPIELNSNAEIAADTTEVIEEKIIRLLEERLVIDNKKQKVGDVIVRKEIKTRIVQVPVQYEKLIVEQVSPEYKQLAEVDLHTGDEIVPPEMNVSTEVTSLDEQHTVSGEFSSPATASLLLNAIAHERRHGCTKVRVEVVVEDTERQSTYQEWFDRCTK